MGGEASGNYVVLRFNQNGALDTTFGTSGRAVTHFSDPAFGREIAVEPDGRILEPGMLGGNGGVGVVRLTQGGEPDPTFGDGDGNVFLLPGVGSSGAGGSGIQVRADHKIVIGGFARKGSSSSPFDAALFQLTPAGKPDATFGGGDGMSLIDMDGDFDTVLAMAVQKDGEILLAGAGGPSGTSAVLLRAKPGGTRDAGFGSNGAVSPTFQVSGSTTFSGVSIQTDGRIVVAGFSHAHADHVITARLLA